MVTAEKTECWVPWTGAGSLGWSFIGTEGKDTGERKSERAEQGSLSHSGHRQQGTHVPPETSMSAAATEVLCLLFSFFFLSHATYPLQVLKGGLQ